VRLRSKQPTPDVTVLVEAQLRKLEAARLCSVASSDNRGYRVVFRLTTIRCIGKWGVPEFLPHPHAILRVRDLRTLGPQLSFVDAIPFHPFVRNSRYRRGLWVDLGLSRRGSVEHFLEDVARLLRFDGIDTDGQKQKYANDHAMEWYRAWVAMTRKPEGRGPDGDGKARPIRARQGNGASAAGVDSEVVKTQTYRLDSGEVIATIQQRTIIGLTSVGEPIRKGPIRLIVKLRGNGQFACCVSRLSAQPFNPHFTRSRFLRLLPARWVDPSSGPRFTTLDHFVSRIAQALAMEPPGLTPRSAHVGNETANGWFRFWQENSGIVTFPIPLMPPDGGEERRRFTIMQKPAEIGASTVRGADTRFRVDSSDEGYTPEFKVSPFVNAPSQEESTVRDRGVSSAVLYVKDAAMRRIHEHIEWRRRSSANLVEQGGILLGSANRDPETGVVHGVVTDAVPARAGARGSGAHLELGHEAWHAMLEELDVMRGTSGGRMHVIGWYHTHPGELDVFMSSVDRATQEKLFREDWQFAIVLNPQRGVWRAFNGRGSEECRGVWLAPAPF
jgi:hypothetical protein